MFSVVGIADCDYMRQRPPRGGNGLRWPAVITAVLAALLVVNERLPHELRPHLRPTTAVAPVGTPERPSSLAAGRPAIGGKWPGGVISIWNDAPDQAWALAEAMSVWNRSGVRIRFVSASSGAQAMVRVEHSAGASCRGADATRGWSPDARVHIFRLDDSAAACSRYTAAVMLTHELGHVLGLDHQSRACAAMNPAGNYRGPMLCTLSAPWEWDCGLLRTDDVRRAVHLYGGRVLAALQQTRCSLYRPIAAPGAIAFDQQSPSGLASFTFRRPDDVAVPTMVAAERLSLPAYRFAFDRGGCAKAPPAGPGSAWSVAPRQLQRVTFPLESSGRYCLSVWAADAVGRPSVAPAQALLDVH
jgi:hypothetical protein